MQRNFLRNEASLLNRQRKFLRNNNISFKIVKKCCEIVAELQQIVKYSAKLLQNCCRIATFPSNLCKIIFDSHKLYHNLAQRTSILDKKMLSYVLLDCFKFVVRIEDSVKTFKQS